MYNLFLTFLIPFLMGIMSIFILLFISQKANFLVDAPEGDVLKIHNKSISLLGGSGILISAMIGVGIFLGQDYGIKILGIFAGFLIIFLLGFWDDLKWKHVSTIKPLLKFSLLLVCTFVPATILVLVGISFTVLPFYGISVLLGFAYIFVCINAINYQDGMDGLAGGEVFISLLGFIIISLFVGNMLALILSLVFLGAVLAFLCFNFPPAKTFMGDSGAYSLGFIVAVLAMLFSKPFNLHTFLGPVFIIGLPIFDGIVINIVRLTKGKSIFLGDRGHVYDKFLQRGFSTKQTLVICYFLQIILVLIGILIYYA